MEETSENMMAVLPYRLSDDNGCLVGDLAKDVDTVTLTVDEPVLLVRDERVGAPDDVPESLHRAAESIFHRLLSRPTVLIG